jgi:hypothetical protein
VRRKFRNALWNFRKALWNFRNTLRNFRKALWNFRNALRNLEDIRRADYGAGLDQDPMGRRARRVTLSVGDPVEKKGTPMRTPTRWKDVRSVTVSWLPLILLAAFAIALAFAPARARAAADDDKDWKVLGETKIKDAKDAASAKDAGGGSKDRKRGDGEKKEGKDGAKKGGDKKDGGDKKAEAGTAAGEIDVVPALVKRIKFEVRGAEVTFKKITVTYESGDPEEIEVREEKVRNRGRTRTIDLKGGNRAIKKVLVSYKAEKTDNAKDSDRDALIVLLGHK